MPPLFAAIVVINFSLIIIDRAIYTSKSIKAKFLMQIVTVLTYNAWIFFILPPSNKYYIIIIRLFL